MGQILSLDTHERVQLSFKQEKAAANHIAMSLDRKNALVGMAGLGGLGDNLEEGLEMARKNISNGIRASNWEGKRVRGG